MATWITAIIFILLTGVRGSAQDAIHTPLDPNLLAETLNQDKNNLDFDRREVMIPMRDGVRLFTIVLVPRANVAMPMMLTRTPYGASRRSPREKSTSMESALPGGDDIFSGTKYIRVFQDVRGRYRSEGEYVMTMPLRGPLNKTSIDHSTDAYDTIEWLVKNIPESNGRVGMIGTSYDGLLVLMGLVNPHPGLKVAVAINPMVDTWIGDDWFHNGAFRQMMVDFIYNHSASRDYSWTENGEAFGNAGYYQKALEAGSAEQLGHLRGVDTNSFWKNLLQHPAYDDYWQSQAMDKILARQPLKVPTMYIHSLWDQEDIYGAVAAYEATEPADQNNDKNFLVIGPWSHGRSNANGGFLGPLNFSGDTAHYFRHTILLPFLEERLKENAPKANTPPVLAYETGANSWLPYNSWPQSCRAGCPQKMQPLYLTPGLRLRFDAPASVGKPYSEYVSDPAHPVPYSTGTIVPVYSPGSTWDEWLVQDQESFSARSDVLSYQSDILKEPVELSGQPIANLFASTSGTDSDFVVKLIDVYPQKGPSQPELNGYQLMISGDILRGRYRSDRANPTPIPEGAIELYRWTLPATSHVFLPGHRIMVQIQSSWFPLYDRNPQTYVENIFLSRPKDFRKATQRIYQTGQEASFIELPVVKQSSGDLK